MSGDGLMMFKSFLVMIGSMLKQSIKELCRFSMLFNSLEKYESMLCTGWKSNEHQTQGTILHLKTFYLHPILMNKRIKEICLFQGQIYKDCNIDLTNWIFLQIAMQLHSVVRLHDNMLFEESYHSDLQVCWYQQSAS
jgi:hypothetical protein